MHILTFILIFIVGSIAAAMKGDYSGIEAIVQFMIAAVVMIVLLFIVAWLVKHQIIMLIAIAAFFVAIIVIGIVYNE